MKLLFYSAILLSSLVSKAQERTNKPLPDINPTVISELSEATGWSVNPEGQWVSRPYKIPVQIEDKYKALIDYSLKGKGIDNFITWRQYSITLGGKTYPMLVKRYKTGGYRYPTLQKDWYDEQGMSYYILDPAELQKLTGMKAKEPNLIRMTVLYSNGNAPLNDLQDLKLQIVKDLDKKSNFEHSLVLNIAPYPEKGIVQFLLFGESLSGSFKYADLNELRQDSKYSPKTKPLFQDPDIFKDAYYETDLKKFQSFLPISIK